MNTRTKFLLAVGSLVILSIACGGSTGGNDDQAANLAATQQSLEATQAALANQPDPTQAPVATEASEAEPSADVAAEDPAFYVEEFSDAPATWSYFLLSGEEADFELYAEGDRMIFDINGPDVWAYYTYDSYTYTDVRLDARAENLGSNNNNVSFICRANERGWYEFNVANNGLYNIYRYEDSTGDFHELYSGGVQNLKTGKDTNEYTIICEGNRLTLGVNGVEVRTVEDGTYDEGLVGISVSSFEFFPVLVEFDWTEISQP